MDLSAEEFKKKGTYTYGFLAMILIVIIVGTAQFVRVQSTIGDLKAAANEFRKFKDTQPATVEAAKENVIAKFKNEIAFGKSAFIHLEDRVNAETDHNITEHESIKIEIRELRDRLIVLETKVNFDCK